MRTSTWTPRLRRLIVGSEETDVTETMTQELTTVAAGQTYFITETAAEIYPAPALASAHLGQTGSGTTRKSFDARTIFFLGLLLAGSGLVSPPVALVGGIAFGFTVVHPYRKEASSLAKLLLQISVVLLGFGINLHQVIRLTATLFLIGTSLSKKTLQAVGVRPFLQGVLLWIFVGTASLIAIKTGLIAI